MQPIKLISLRHSAFYTPYLMTFAADFLSQQGLKPDYRCVSSVDELEAALLEGSADVAQSAVGISMRQFDANPTRHCQILHFAQINQRDGFFIAAAKNDMSSDNFDWKSLEDKRIIADHLFQPMATLKYVLDKNKVDVSKVEFINAGDVEQSQAAFLAGKADFIHLQGPYPQQLVEDGKACIVASVGDALGNFAFSSLCATKSWLASPMAEKFIAAYKAALTYVQVTDASQLAKQLKKQFPTIKLSILSETITAYKDLGSWSKCACISKDAFESANKVFLFSGDISKRISYEKIISTELC